jgi:hypothetical protein
MSGIFRQIKNSLFSAIFDLGKNLGHALKKTKKPRNSFAARRFPVYNLMKSLQICGQQSLSFTSLATLSIIDDTKVRDIGTRAKYNKQRLLKYICVNNLIF